MLKSTTPHPLQGGREGRGARRVLEPKWRQHTGWCMCEPFWTQGDTTQTKQTRPPGVNSAIGKLIRTDYTANARFPPNQSAQIYIIICCLLTLLVWVYAYTCAFVFVRTASKRRSGDFGTLARNTSPHLPDHPRKQSAHPHPVPPALVGVGDGGGQKIE